MVLNLRRSERTSNDPRNFPGALLLSSESLAVVAVTAIAVVWWIGLVPSFVSFFFFFLALYTVVPYTNTTAVSYGRVLCVRSSEQKKRIFSRRDNLCCLCFFVFLPGVMVRDLTKQDYRTAIAGVGTRRGRGRREGRNDAMFFRSLRAGVCARVIAPLKVC